VTHRIEALHRIVTAGAIAFDRAGTGLPSGATVAVVPPHAVAATRIAHPDVLLGVEGPPGDADFVVGPFDAEVARECDARRIAYVPYGDGAADLDLVLLTALTAPRPTRSRFIGLATPDEPVIGEWLAAGADGVAVEAPARATDTWFTDALWQVRKINGWPLYGAVEHVGLHAQPGVSDVEIAQWYADTFDYPVAAGRTLYVGRDVFGRIEVLKAPVGEPCHVGVRVWDFDAAVADLGKRGREIQEPVTFPASKLAYLRDRDPAGNLVHIIWRP